MSPLPLLMIAMLLILFIFFEWPLFLPFFDAAIPTILAGICMCGAAARFFDSFLGLFQGLNKIIGD